MPERDLARALAEGDLRALAALYDSYAARVFSLALRHLHDAGAAEEAVQDVFLKICRARGVFDATRGDLSAWIFAIARNAVYDRLRREARRQREQAVDTASLDALAETPFEALERLLARERLAGLLADLPPEQSDMVRLVYVEGRTVAEAARALGTPLGTAKSRLRAALRGMRRSLAGEVETQ